MPLERIIHHNASTTIYIWKIEEDFDDLFDTVVLNDINMVRMFAMKAKQHQLGFMSVRRLLQEAGYNDHDLHYGKDGKPHLKDGKHISISHSHLYSAIVVSDKPFGIDIELQREKIIVIADKFCEYELQYLDAANESDYIRRLTIIWGIKESIFKIQNEIGISYKDHIKVTEFKLEDKQARAWLHFNDLLIDFIIDFEEIDNYSLVLASENV
ncbi:MAG TPA: 4'-phosphopantetheinyl transferase superfamily protein [Flavobacterium sp.]|jgi:phosphopantetheinyl transferase